MKKKNPHVAALMGMFLGPLSLGPLAYIYVWRVGRGIVVFLAGILLTGVIGQLYSAVINEIVIGLFSGVAIGIFSSFDCWRITKLENKKFETKEVVEEKEAKPKPVVSEIKCPRCRFSLALPYKACPNCNMRIILQK